MDINSENCCKTDTEHTHKGRSFDLILHGSLSIIFLSLLIYGFAPTTPYLVTFVEAILELLSRMWWGVALGIIFVGLMSKIPREYYTIVLGRGDTAGGIIRAAIAGLFLDLCSHGILMIGAKLYERGASLAQVMTFLIASPWNSLSLTIILVSLIGLKWTLIYVAASALIAIVTGLLYQALTASGRLPDNPNKTELTPGFSMKDDAKARLKEFKPSRKFFKDIALSGLRESKMIIKWLLFGVIIASAIRSFVPAEIFADWFGPTLVGLLLTLAATTIIEVCSEGSAPIASELFTRAAAPGNAFTFLMAGVATDYTEILIIREFTKSWKIAFTLPLLTVPQVIIFGYLMNMS